MTALIIGGIILILLIVLIAKRINDKEKENFEKRDNKLRSQYTMQKRGVKKRNKGRMPIYLGSGEVHSSCALMVQPAFSSRNWNCLTSNS